MAIPSMDMGTRCRARAAIVAILVPHLMTMLSNALPKMLHGRGSYPGSFNGNSNGTDTTTPYYYQGECSYHSILQYHEQGLELKLRNSHRIC